MHFNKAVSWAGPSMDVISWNLSRPFKWWHCVQQDRIIEKMICERHAETRATDSPGTKAAVDLFLQAYREEKMGASGKGGRRTDKLDPEFLNLARDNVKTLLLESYDTTSSSMAYTLALLSEPENTHELARIRAEHDVVFGPDPTEAAAMLLSDPRLLNNLPLTTAAVKESMRLFPAASTTRTTMPNHPAQTVSFRSQQLPLASQQIWLAHYGFGRRGDLWPEPRKFVIDRFMPMSGETSPPPPSKGRMAPVRKGLARLSVSAWSWP
ncbi:hypothetical protein FOPE_10629 [Fonsecaea pedrosoi]|nr:hypothetical protein FOPE_10629 [Fonsecaea pedrosoi]